MKIYNSIAELVGNTPLLRLNNFEKKHNLGAEIYAKLEFFNPAGSAKDRVAKEIIEDYERQGKLKKGSTIIEPTSGNTGIGLAAICASRGYRAIIVMPDTMSRERQLLMSAYGAELILTDGKLGMQGAIDKVYELADKIEDAIVAGQFENPSNPNAHYKTTGREIWEDTDGELDIFVSAVGTGGSISGTGRYLKEQKPSVEIVAVEPEGSPYLTRGIAGSHKIQGIGAGFIPKTLDISIYDQILTITDDEAYATASEIAKTDGVLVGISSGAALCAAKKIASEEANKDKKIVVLLADTGERYLSAGVFN